MKIDIRIPFDPSGNLGAEYNRIMEESKTEYVLFLDHDVLLLHPNWYHICQEAIKQYPNCGLFTCSESFLYENPKEAEGKPLCTASMYEQRSYAKYMWEIYKYNCTRIVNENEPFCGFFMLIKKSAWEQIGGFREGFYVDEDFKRKLLKNGIEVYRIDGLYTFHFRDRCETWVDGLRVSKNYFDSLMTYRKKLRGRFVFIPSIH